MGLRGYHNFVADPDMVGYAIMARRIPCLCEGCKARMNMPIDYRYSNPCNDCKYYSMYQGANDWIKITFQAGKDVDDDIVITANQWTLQQIGKRMSETISVGKIGAYLVDDQIKYYLVKWTCEPYLVEKENVETAGGIARCGEWVCNGVWLNDVPRAPHWYWISDVEVVVRCQFILCCDLELHSLGPNNDLPRLNVNYRAEVLSNNPIKLCVEDHDDLMDAASHREGLDYDEEIREEEYDDDYESDGYSSSDTVSEEEQ